MRSSKAAAAARFAWSAAARVGSGENDPADVAVHNQEVLEARACPLISGRPLEAFPEGRKQVRLLDRGVLRDQGVTQRPGRSHDQQVKGIRGKAQVVSFDHVLNLQGHRDEGGTAEKVLAPVNQTRGGVSVT